MNHFHAHIYFTENLLEHALTLSKHAYSLDLFNSIKLHPKPIGPHPTGMLELHFNDSTYTEAINWIKNNREDLSVLIHKDTGDDVKDHTDGIQWLGEKVPLDFNFFELILSRPELRINQ